MWQKKHYLKIQDGQVGLIGLPLGKIKRKEDNRKSPTAQILLRATGVGLTPTHIDGSDMVIRNDGLARQTAVKQDYSEMVCIHWKFVKICGMCKFSLLF